MVTTASVGKPTRASLTAASSTFNRINAIPRKSKDHEIFIVQNSVVEGWTGLRYLEEITTMITSTQIAAAVDRLAQEAQPERILLFGSHARGEAREDSDLDLLVIESEVTDRAAEMVRLRRALRPLRIPVDILVYSSADVVRWGNQPGSALFWALREGKVVYG